MNLTEYSKVYNDISLVYLGHLKEHIIQLEYILKFLRHKYKDINIHFGSETKGYVKEFTINSNSIYDFFKDSISFPHLNVKGTKCCLSLDIDVSKKFTLTGEQIDKLIKHYNAEISNEIDKYDWVIGLENEYIFQAGQSKRVTLIPSGNTELFKWMFPHGEICKILN